MKSKYMCKPEAVTANRKFCGNLTFKTQISYKERFTNKQIKEALRT